MNIIKSYTYNGKTYDFVSNRKARIEIENLQTNFLSTNKEAREKLQQLDKLQSKVANAKDKEEKEKYQQELMSLQYDLIPYINEVNIPDEQICYIILKNYKPYREEMTPALWEEILDDMDEKLGSIGMREFFADITNEVFIELAKVQQITEQKMVARNELLKVTK